MADDTQINNYNDWVQYQYGISADQLSQLASQYQPGQTYVPSQAGSGGGGTYRTTENPQLTNILNVLSANKAIGNLGQQQKQQPTVDTGPVQPQNVQRALGAYAMGQPAYIEQQIPGKVDPKSGVAPVGQEQYGQTPTKSQMQQVSAQAFGVPGVVGGSASDQAYAGTPYGAVAPTQGGGPTSPTSYPTGAPVQQGTPWASAPGQPTSIGAASKSQMMAMASKKGFPGMAKGGVAQGPVVVGEQGKELVIPSGPTQIIPLKGQDNKKLPHMQGGGQTDDPWAAAAADATAMQAYLAAGQGQSYSASLGGGAAANPIASTMAAKTITGGAKSSTGQPPAAPGIGASQGATPSYHPGVVRLNSYSGPGIGASILSAVGSAIGAIGGAIGMGAHPAAAPGAVAQEAASNVGVPAPTGNVTQLTPGVQGINPLSGYGMPQGQPTPNWTPSMIRAYQGGQTPSAFQQAWANASPWANTRVSPADAAVMNQATATPMTPFQRWQQMAQAGQRQPQPQPQQPQQPAPITPVPMGTTMTPSDYIRLQQRTQQS